MGDTPNPAAGATRSPWHAVEEIAPDVDNFHTSIYEDDYDGLLIARCNQNGQHPDHARLIVQGGAGKKEGADLLQRFSERIANLEASLVTATKRAEQAERRVAELEEALAWIEDHEPATQEFSLAHEWRNSLASLSPRSLAMTDTVQAPEVGVEEIEAAAKAAFSADWPKDRWGRFERDDHVPNRYRKIAEAALRAAAAVRSARPEGEVEKLTKERDDLALYAQSLQIALTGLAGGGSENFIQHGDGFRADIIACVVKVRQRHTEMTESFKTELRARKAAEATIAKMREENERLRQGKDRFKAGVRAAVTWLHSRGRKMNDPHAKAILDCAADHLGSTKAWEDRNPRRTTNFLYDPASPLATPEPQATEAGLPLPEDR